MFLRTSKLQCCASSSVHPMRWRRPIFWRSILIKQYLLLIFRFLYVRTYFYFFVCFEVRLFQDLINRSTIPRHKLLRGRPQLDFFSRATKFDVTGHRLHIFDLHNFPSSSDKLQFCKSKKI